MNKISKDKYKTESFTLLHRIYQFPNKSVRSFQSLSLFFDVTNTKDFLIECRQTPLR